MNRKNLVTTVIVLMTVIFAMSIVFVGCAKKEEEKPAVAVKEAPKAKAIKLDVPMAYPSKLPGLGTRVGHQLCRNIPKAPPPHPPMTIEGPNTPPEPPLPIVRPVVKIFPKAIASSTQALMLVSGVMAS